VQSTPTQATIWKLDPKKLLDFEVRNEITKILQSCNDISK
ncbi:7291_t:CDS:1, partial [Scutellospora calospora]